jgi:shikimate kinase
MNERAHPIIITGFMGAGKTEVAAALARRLACAMIDLDQFVREREGRTPQVIIDEDGEQRFREIESEALRDALETGAHVIALGGGTWTISDNRAFVNQHQAFTVWLDAPFELCWKRIAGESNSRPLARNVEDARRLYDERRKFYDQAMLRIEVSEDKSADTVTAEIVKALPQQQESKKMGNNQNDS